MRKIANNIQAIALVKEVKMLQELWNMIDIKYLEINCFCEGIN